MSTEKKIEKKKIYLAGPDVFRFDAIDFGMKLKAKCHEYGYKGMYPFDNEVDLTQDKRSMAKEIFTANRHMIDNCDIVIANLEPFRGPSADVGTVWECGYALGLGKKVYGYRESKELYKDKAGYDPARTVEDFDLGDNLMIDCSIQIFDSLEDVLKHLAKEV